MRSVWDIAYETKEVLISTADYFDKLLAYIDQKNADLKKFKQQQDYDAGRPGVVFADLFKRSGVDPRNIPLIEYQSRSRLLRLYCNWPVGYIIAEVENIVPYTGKRSVYAICIGVNDEMSPSNAHTIGTFLGSGIPYVNTFGIFLLGQLLDRELTEEELNDRALLIEAVRT